MLYSIKNFIKSNTGLLIRMDDIAEHMNWKLMNKCETLFDKYNIRPLLGVIPNNKDEKLHIYEKKENFWQKVRLWQEKGWEISMHGFSHVYDTETKKKDYFNYGGRSEFFGHDYETQLSRIRRGLEKFQKENIQIRSFFAPNHTYDKNTFKALRESGIKYIIDGYGLFPYKENDIIFIPQLFYKEIILPFGIQSTQMHLNYWVEKDYEIFEKFIIKNYDKIICFEDCIKKTNDGLFSKLINFGTKTSLKSLRYFR